MTERQKYFRLVADVVEILPSAIDTAGLLAGIAHSSSAIQNARLGRAATQLPLLVQMIEMAMPDFHINPDFRPATQEQGRRPKKVAKA